MMKAIVIATLLGFFLSTPATANCARQMKSHTSTTANSYVYINRIASPVGNPATKTSDTTAEQLSKQL